MNNINTAPIQHQIFHDVSLCSLINSEGKKEGNKLIDSNEIIINSLPIFTGNWHVIKIKDATVLLNQSLHYEYHWNNYNRVTIDPGSISNYLDSNKINIHLLGNVSLCIYSSICLILTTSIYLSIDRFISYEIKFLWLT
jgi:hypothetical protein